MKLFIFFLFVSLPIQANDEDLLANLVASELRRLRFELANEKRENEELLNKVNDLKEKLNGCENKNTKISDYVNIGLSTIGAIAGGVCATR